MKKSLFLLLLFWVNALPAQNYQNICSPGITFYKDFSDKLLAFRSDSIIVTGNNDTLFISYTAIRDTSGECRDVGNGSILGRKILKKSNGFFCFFNRYQDSIFIYTQATINQTWKFCNLPSGSYIQAQVTSIITDSVLGATDQVKVITFQAKNSSNVNIGHFLNGRTIKLSQHYGLSSMFDVYYLPGDTAFYTLAGKSFQNMGIQDISWQQIYHFDVGDVFHYYGSWWTSLGSWYTTRTIETILGKTIYGNNDSVSYQIEKCVRIDASYPPHYGTSFDTVTKIYSLRDGPLLLPSEFTDTLKPPDYYATISIQNDRLKKGVITGTNIYEPATNCYTNQFESMYTDDSYIFGLGHTYHYYQYWSDGLFTYSESLAYYEKGTEIWGTPLATDCSVLTNTETKTVSQESSIDLYPNPAETSAQVFLHGFNPSDNLILFLYNYSGIKVYEGKASANPFTLNRDGLASGFYVLVISDMTGMIKGRTKINFK